MEICEPKQALPANPKLKVLSMFLKAYPNARLDEEGLAVYVLLLDSVSLIELKLAMKKLVMSSRFFPSVAEILAAVDSLRRTIQPGTLSVEEAWQEVQDQMRAAFPYKKPVFSTPEIAKTVRSIGWMMICTVSPGDVAIVRAQFRDAYKNIIHRAKDRQENVRLIQQLSPDRRREYIRMLNGKPAQPAQLEEGAVNDDTESNA